MGKLLLVEDDRNAALRLRELIEPHGWTVELADNGGDGLQMLSSFSYDLILLDWNLPDMTGLDICRKYRRDGGQTPIIFLTARHEVEDKEAGLDAGGDDYLTKPFEVRELMARIRSMQRRPPKLFSGKLDAGGVQLDPQQRVASFGEESTQLSALECKLLEFLFRNPNEFFSSAQLFESIWSSDAESSAETVRVHMTVLRRKLALIGAANVIETVRKSGYIVRK